MKKSIIILLTFTFISAHSFAQATEPLKPVKTGDEWKMPADVFKRSQTFADSLKKELALDATTTKKVYDAYLANTKPTDEILILPISDNEKKEKLKTNHESFNMTLKGILSQEQFQKYLKLDNAQHKKKTQTLLILPTFFISNQFLNQSLIFNNNFS
jgi:hypothetical protein